MYAILDPLKDALLRRNEDLELYRRRIMKLERQNIKAEERCNRRIHELEEVIFTLKKQDVENEETSFENERKSRKDEWRHISACIDGMRRALDRAVA